MGFVGRSAAAEQVQQAEEVEDAAAAEASATTGWAPSVEISQVRLPCGRRWCTEPPDLYSSVLLKMK